MRVLGLLGAVLVAAGVCACSHAAKRAPSGTTGGQPAAPEPEHFVAWGESPKLGRRSYWLEYAAGKLKVRGEVSGAAFFARGGVYQFRQTKGVAQILKSCPPLGFGSGEEPDDSPELVDVEVVGAVAERLDAAGTLTIEALPRPENAELFGNSVDLRASVGAYLFVSSSEDARYCGAAHDAGSYFPSTFDLTSGHSVDFPTPADRAALKSWSLANRRPQLRKCFDGRMDNGQPLGDDVHEQLDVQAVFPTLSKQGQFGFDVELGTYRSHVEGFLSCQVSSDLAPPSLKGLQVPKGLRALAQQMPDLELHGFSVLEAKASAVAVDRAFSEQVRRERER